ncbi:hypothetical protein GRAN_3639 [Granulicella sibirica]|uniref:Uncharacterized protein n=1 Tax=Granulicella sibirica TaxID=2479048 RepID=A0A4Q0SZM1_9BACT|nr:hypothetical protein GRAN_3639 [Granulicella sibirica]
MPVNPSKVAEAVQFVAATGTVRLSFARAVKNALKGRPENAWCARLVAASD